MKKKKASKSSAQKRAAKKPAAQRQAAASYTPKPLKGNGWAPFRYPPQ
jgi:hypothetical protein